MKSQGPTTLSEKTLPRIQQELADITNNDIDFAIELGPDPEQLDPFTWKTKIVGPPGTPYEGGQFKVTIVIPHDYPHSPPKVEFDT